MFTARELSSSARSKVDEAIAQAAQPERRRIAVTFVCPDGKYMRLQGRSARGSGSPAVSHNGWKQCASSTK
jgi:hypothetical protein